MNSNVEDVPPVEQLLDHLEHGSEDERFDAVWRLARTENPRIVPRLITLLQSSPDMGVRKDAAYLLGFAGDLQARPMLLAALRDRANDLDVRCHAAEALGHLLDLRRGEREVRAALRDALTEDPAELRFWAAFALGNVGITEDIRALRPLAESDHRVVPSWWAVSKEAADVIAAIEERRLRQRLGALGHNRGVSVQR